MKAGLTLVTGGTGFLGQHLVQRLLDSGNTSLRLLTSSPAAAPTSDHPAWDEVQWLHGSLTDPELAKRAVDDVTAIYHLAGRVSNSSEDAHELYRLHVDGTRYLCEAARAAGVRRIVMASTSGTIAVSEDPEPHIDETSPPPMALIARWPYYASKFYQEQAALRSCSASSDTAPASKSRGKRRAQKHTELVILQPSLLLGPGDSRLSSTNDVLRFMQRDLPFIPRGGLNFVDVRDAADAFFVAMDRGTDGERYLLGSVNWTLEEFFGRLERLTKVPAPRLHAPAKLAERGARVIELLYKAADRSPPIEAARVEMANCYWYFDDSKARRDLGFTSRDPTETLLDTVSDLRQRFGLAAVQLP